MIKKVLLAAVACGVFATPAFAQEAPVHSGFRIEALGGYDQIKISVDEDVAGEELSGSTDGVLYGIGLGYDYSTGGLVLGVEGEIAQSSIGQDVAFDEEEIEGSIVDGTAGLHVAEDIYLGGRIGAVAGNTLFYAKAGYSMATVKFDAAGTVDGEPGELAADLGMNGVRIGLGVEHQFSGRFYGKLEYRYTDYSDAEIEAEGEELGVDELFDYVNVKRHQVGLGLGYRF